MAKDRTIRALRDMVGDLTRENDRLRRENAKRGNKIV